MDNVDNLLKTLRIGTAAQQEASATALGESGDPRAVEALQQATKSDYLYVRQAAAAALEHINPQKLRPTLTEMKMKAEQGEKTEKERADREQMSNKINKICREKGTVSPHLKNTGIRYTFDDGVLELVSFELEDDSCVLWGVGAIFRAEKVFHNGAVWGLPGVYADCYFIRGEWEEHLNKYLV